MARFKFRLEAPLRIAQKTLEEEQIILAQEEKKLLQLEEEFQRQQREWEDALQGQREASLKSPQDLSLWLHFSQRQLELLRIKKEEVAQQEEVTALQRQKLIEAHQDKEKLEKLRARQEAEFNLMEQRREQALLDEAGQNNFRRRKTL
ncbi:MAG: FliJ family protein [Desulfitobacterium sp.]|nr:FliJ family protein [Desulfitobacterium sp.]